MPEQESGHEKNHAAARASRTVDELVATYLDRLNSGETIDPFVIISDHPDIGDEILEKLETFVELTRGPEEGTARLTARTTTFDLRLEEQSSRLIHR